MIVQYHPITYIKIRVPFQAILKDSSQTPTPYLEIADTSNIKQDNPCNNQGLLLNMSRIYLLLLSSHYIKIMFTLNIK